MPDVSIFEAPLREGRNELGLTQEVVAAIQADPSLFGELVATYRSDDEWVRLRVSSALKRVARSDPALVYTRIDDLLTWISEIDQPSTQWTQAQVFDELRDLLTVEQRARAIAIMQGNLDSSTDWIVINQTLGTLGQWARDDDELRDWLLPRLARFVDEPRRSISGRARKLLGALQV